jgi:hypothetical protein
VIPPLIVLEAAWAVLAAVILFLGVRIGQHYPNMFRRPSRVAAERAEAEADEPPEVYGQAPEPDWPEVPEWDTTELLGIRLDLRNGRQAELSKAAPLLVAVSDRLRERLALAAERAEWAGAWRAGQDSARAELFPAPPAPATLDVPGAFPGFITTPVRQLSSELLEFAGLPLEDSRAWWDGQAAAAAGEGACNGVL